MVNKRITLTAKELLELFRGEEIAVQLKETYFDLDAGEELSTGKWEWISLKVD